MRKYRVSFDTYRDRIESAIHYCCTARNQKEARAIAEELWYMKHKAHMFHIRVRRLSEDEPYRESFVVDISAYYNWGRR